MVLTGYSQVSLHAVSSTSASTDLVLLTQTRRPVYHRMSTGRGEGVHATTLRLGK